MEVDVSGPGRKSTWHLSEHAKSWGKTKLLQNGAA